MKSLSRKVIVGSFFLLVAGILVVGRLSERPVALRLGVTISSQYIQELGMNVRETITAIFDELQPTHIRVPVYWNEVEPEEGQWKLDDLDWIMVQAERRGITVTLAVGEKVPRWPECFVPDWALNNGQPDEGKLRSYVQTIVERYRGSSALVRWQVENEPLFEYGECSPPDADRLTREIQLVHTLDARPVVVTVSGELQTWKTSADLADILGISIYRESWNPVFKYVRYPLPVWFYRFRSWMVRGHVDSIVISELQAEPWFDRPLSEVDAPLWANRFTPEDLRANVSYAARTGIAEADLWGAEWWYWLKVHGEPGLWDAAQELFESVK